MSRIVRRSGWPPCRFARIASAHAGRLQTSPCRSSPSGRTRPRNPAEYPYLEGKKVAILVWVDEYTSFQYQFLPLEVSEHVRATLEGSVRGVSVVPNRQIIDYQAANRTGSRGTPPKSAKNSGPTVIVIEVTQYTTREPAVRTCTAATWGQCEGA